MKNNRIKNKFMNIKILCIVLVTFVISGDIIAQRVKKPTTSTHITSPIRVSYNNIDKTISITSTHPDRTSPIKSIIAFSSFGEIVYTFGNRITNEFKPVYIMTTDWNPGIYIINIDNITYRIHKLD